MPHKPHPCAYPGCERMLPRKESKFCRKHAIKTPEHVAKIAAAIRGQKRTSEQKARMSTVKKAWAAEMRASGRWVLKPKRQNSPKSPPAKRNCVYCGKSFSPTTSAMRFCSRRCGYDNRRGENAPNWKELPLLTCRVCGKQFRVSAQSQAAKRFACSYTCKNVWQKTHQKTKGTDIERIMEAALITRGWSYQSQVGLCNIATVDFFLPDSKTVIFCDGDYWHSLPDHIARDARQTAILQTNGYTVHRFLGSVIKTDVNACLDEVEHHFSCRTSGT